MSTKICAFVEKTEKKNQSGATVEEYDPLWLFFGFWRHPNIRPLYSKAEAQLYPVEF